MICLSLPPHFTWAHGSFLLILINEWTLLSASMLYNLASCVHIHYQELIPPWGPYSSHVSQTAIKQQSVCEAEWLFLKSSAFPNCWFLCNDKGFWQLAQPQERETSHCHRLKIRRHELKVGERRETICLSLFMFVDSYILKANRYLTHEQIYSEMMTVWNYSDFSGGWRGSPVIFCLMWWSHDLSLCVAS